MWSSALSILILLLSYWLTSWMMGSMSSAPCTIIITGESVRITGCHLSAEHIKALSHLKALQVRL
ncbi:triple gene block 3 protein [Kalanchoe latent virus]|uniref:Movement protein TGBp3 n=1 Tax=Kalanchoe latent virus TaxID=132477 RepID=Q9ICW4_9VIRU|nr:triple gene block 3 protein [Kalanchoe latent virus]ACL01036.1 triple gene block 3 protein [Kalanchoe latent virus]UZN89662.1 triple gene block protein 3 [Kalanchoe latent virus]CAB97505.1 hypothetical protein, 7K [Kalanchoe latent virus]